MNLEQQVCSLENAKRLKELGVKQDSLFWHVGDDSFSEICRDGEQIYEWEDDQADDHSENQPTSRPLTS